MKKGAFTVSHRNFENINSIATSHLCEIGFSSMATMKTTQRNRLTLKNDVFLCVSTIEQCTENL